MPPGISATCNVCGKRFLINHALSFPKGGLVLVWHDNAAKEWVALGSRALVPSAITYEPKINSRILAGERTRNGARQEGGIDKDGAKILGESQGGGSSGQTVNGPAVLAGCPGKVEVTAESRAYLSAHGF